MNSEERLREYINNEPSYQDYKQGIGVFSDLDMFCIENCKDIEELLDKIKELEREVNASNECVNELLKVQERNEKAINYIKNDWYELNTRDIEHILNLGKDIRIDLLNILQGDDNDKD